jgi:hypothetical protein
MPAAMQRAPLTSSSWCFSGGGACNQVLHAKGRLGLLVFQPLPRHSLLTCPARPLRHQLAPTTHSRATISIKYKRCAQVCASTYYLAFNKSCCTSSATEASSCAQLHICTAEHAQQRLCNMFPHGGSAHAHLFHGHPWQHGCCEDSQRGHALLAEHTGKACKRGER